MEPLLLKKMKFNKKTHLFGFNKTILLENGSKNSIFNFFSKPNLDYETFLNTTEILTTSNV